MNEIFASIKTEQTAAILPAPILWAAAQFASKDACRSRICNIQLTRNENETVTVRATDDYRGFRVTLPEHLAYMEAAELKIPSEQFRKPGKLLTAEWLHLRTDGAAAAFDLPAMPTELRAWTECPHGFDFPNLDQVWPDTYHNEPGSIIGANGQYLATIATVAAKLSRNGTVTMATNGANQPLQLTADYKDTDVSLQFLLMPVQLRSDEHQASQKAKKKRDRQRAQDAKDLQRYRSQDATRLPELATV